MRNFQSLLEQGKVTEIKIAEWLISNGLEVKDVSDDDYYKNIDVDLIVYDNNHRLHTIEVKSDDIIHKTKNIFIEHGMDRKNGWKMGWIKYCQAELLCYHDNILNVGYILNWKKVQSEIKQFYTSTKFWNVTDNCWGWGYLVPISEAYKLSWVLKEYDLNKRGE